MSLRHIRDLESCPLCDDKLKSAHPDLAEWYKTQVKPNFPDCHISWSYRDKVDQEICFLNKRSNDHFPHSPHNASDENGNPCSRALDLFQLDDQGHAVFSPLYFEKIDLHNSDNGLEILWGGKWKELGDFDHFQLKPIEPSNG